MALTAEQQALRRTYLGGTDVAALAGLNPPGWAQPIDVFADKRPDVIAPRERPAGAMQNLGNLLEDAVAQVFSAASGQPVRVLPGARTPAGARPTRHPRYRHHGGNLDRMTQVADGRWVPLECKTSQRHQDEWGPTDATGTAVVAPARYLVQLQWYLHVAGRQEGYLAVLLGFGRFEWYRVPRDQALIDGLVELAEGFWREHVLPGVPPPPDGSDTYDSVLRRRYRASDGTEAVATPYQQGLILQYRAARDQADAASQALALAQQQLMASMGTTERLIAPGAVITWRSTRPRTSVDWEAVAWDGWYSQAAEYATGDDEQVVMAAEAVAAAVDDHTTTSDGTRPFSAKFDQEG